MWEALSENWCFVIIFSFLFELLGLNFSGFYGIPYAVGTAAYNTMNYGSNGAGGKFQNNKVQSIHLWFLMILYILGYVSF